MRKNFNSKSKNLKNSIGVCYAEYDIEYGVIGFHLGPQFLYYGIHTHHERMGWLGCWEHMHVRDGTPFPATQNPCDCIPLYSHFELPSRPPSTPNPARPPSTANPARPRLSSVVLHFHILFRLMYNSFLSSSLVLRCLFFAIRTTNRLGSHHIATHAQHPTPSRRFRGVLTQSLLLTNSSVGPATCTSIPYFQFVVDTTLNANCVRFRTAKHCID